MIRINYLDCVSASVGGVLRSGWTSKRGLGERDTNSSDDVLFPLAPTSSSSSALKYSSDCDSLRLARLDARPDTIDCFRLPLGTTGGTPSTKSTKTGIEP